VPSPPSPSVRLARALEGSEPLARLLQRVEESRARHAVVIPLLPEGLRGAVRAGPLDDEGWSLLVDHGAAAAKLRQLLPRLEAALAERGFQPRALRVKIQPRER
jgi:hypothetical protein